MQFNWPNPPAAFSPCRRTTIVSLLVPVLASALLFAVDEAGPPESLQPVPAKDSARENPAAKRTLHTLEDLEIVDIGGISFATRQRVLISLTRSHTNAALTDIT
jgi:hypothetical protein